MRALTTAARSLDCGAYTVATYVTAAPDSAQLTAPPRTPLPGDAPCADASRRDATEPTTPEPHTAETVAPGGTTTDRVADRTADVGGTGDSEGVDDGVREGERLDEAVALLDIETDAADDGDADADGETDALTLTDALAPLAEALALDVGDTLRVAERVGDALTDALLE